MIITSELKLEKNKVYTEKDFPTPFEFNHKCYYKYTFYVIREATKDEFIKHLKENYGNDLSNFIFLDYFYKVSID